jgi:glyoxylase-like metal-dependent hydrolase (beta-lactamase superfamily II)
MFPAVSVELHKNGRPVKIHLISTGAVSVKTKFRDATKTGVWAMINFMLDKKFTEWMPIWVMIVEHPAGVFVIDTGENADVNNPGYFKSSGFFANWFDTTQFKFDVKREEEGGSAARKTGIKIDDIASVILTHLHLDHIDGLKYFPNTRILANKVRMGQTFWRPAETISFLVQTNTR